MSLQIEALSPIMWTIIIAVALVLIAAVSVLTDWVFARPCPRAKWSPSPC